MAKWMGREGFTSDRQEVDDFQKNGHSNRDWILPWLLHVGTRAQALQVGGLSLCQVPYL